LYIGAEEENKVVVNNNVRPKKPRRP